MREGCFMRITIQPTKAEDGHPVGVDVRKALEVLHIASIQTAGGGTIGSDGDLFGAIVLQRETDIPKAIALLKQAGIRVSES